MAYLLWRQGATRQNNSLVSTDGCPALRALPRGLIASIRLGIEGANYDFVLDTIQPPAVASAYLQQQ